MPVRVLVGVSGLLLEMSDEALLVGLDVVVLLDLLEITHVVHGERGREVLGVNRKLVDGLVEEVVSRDYEKVGAFELFVVENEMNVSNGSELVGVAGRTVIHDGERQFRLLFYVFVGPSLKIRCEFVVRHDVNALDIGNRSEIVEDPLDHRLAGDFEERLRLV